MSKAATTRQLDPDLAVSSFFKDPTWMSKAGIGATINLLGIVLLLLNGALLPVSVCLWGISAGYLLRYLRQVIADQRAPLPDWKDWLDLMISGLSWLAVLTGFFFVVLSVTSISLVAGANFGIIKASSSYFVAWAGGTFLTTAFLSAALNFFVSALMANFAERESMKAAFEWPRVMRKILERPGDLLAAWLIGVGLQAIAFMVPMITIIGALFIPTTFFIAQLISVSLIAQAWPGES